MEMQSADQTCLVDTAVAHQCSITRVFAPPAADAVPALGASAAGAGASLAAFAFFADEAASELLRLGAMVDLCNAEREKKCVVYVTAAAVPSAAAIMSSNSCWDVGTCITTAVN